MTRLILAAELILIRTTKIQRILQTDTFNYIY